MAAEVRIEWVNEESDLTTLYDEGWTVVSMKRGMAGWHCILARGVAGAGSSSDISDRDVRLLGRVKLLDLAGAPYDARAVNGLRDYNTAAVYSYTLIDAPGVATTPHNFVSLYHPPATGLNIALLSVVVESYSIAVSLARSSLRLSRIIAAAGGTQLGVADISKHNTLRPAPVAVLRVGNPSITLGAVVSGFAPNQSTTVAGATAVSRRVYEPSRLWGQAEFLLRDGEGIAIHQAVAGDIDQTHNVTITWAEYA